MIELLDLLAFAAPGRRGDKGTASVPRFCTDSALFITHLPRLLHAFPRGREHHCGYPDTNNKRVSTNTYRGKEKSLS